MKLTRGLELRYKETSIGLSNTRRASGIAMLWSNKGRIKVAIPSRIISQSQNLNGELQLITEEEEEGRGKYILLCSTAACQVTIPSLLPAEITLQLRFSGLAQTEVEVTARTAGCLPCDTGTIWTLPCGIRPTPGIHDPSIPFALASRLPFHPMLVLLVQRVTRRLPHVQDPG